MSTTVLFAEGLTQCANFYAALLGGELLDQSATFVRVSSDSSEVLIHQIPGATPDVSYAPREGAAMKPIYFVASIDVARSAVANLGGRVYDENTVATYGNVHYCDAVDPEGNVIQLAERLRW
ncbi:MAG: VOC family protein [Candidatus Limnocylindrus sp.]